MQFILFDGRPQKKTTYKIKYDTHENWIELIEYKDNKLETITERVITYY